MTDIYALANLGRPVEKVHFPAEAVPETPRCPCCGQELPKDAS